MSGAIGSFDQGLSVEEKALLGSEAFGQLPMIENMSGWEHTDSRFAENTVVTEAEMSQMVGRDRGAPAWVWDIGGTGSCVVVNTQTENYIYLYNPAAADECFACAAWRALITPNNSATWVASDERLIFEALIAIDGYNFTDKKSDELGFFFGFANVAFEGDWAGTYAANFGQGAGDNTRRFGFVSGNTAAQEYVRPLTADGAAITLGDNQTVDFSEFEHFKIVYDIGTSISYYLNGFN